MKCLITGSLGLTGQACVDLFLEKGWEVVGVDRNMRSRFFGTEMQYPKAGQETIHFDIDIRDLVTMEELFEQHTFNAIVHAAAQPSHDYATEHVLEDFDVNARATVILFELARKYCPDAVIVHVSTDKVYGEKMVADPLEEKETRYDPVGATLSSRGFDEELGLDFAGDRSFFGCSKAAADMYAQQYAARGMKIGLFRPGCITGRVHQGAEQHGFLAYLAKCIKEGKTYKIFGHKGKQVRDQIHASDLASAFWHYINTPMPGVVYNIGGGPARSVSILEAGAMIAKKTGKEFKYEIHEARKGDRVWDVHDTSKFRKDYPFWKQKYNLQAIIDDLL